MGDRQIGLKLDRELAELASHVAHLTGQTLKDLVSTALRKEISSMTRRDEELRVLVAKIDAYKKRPKSEAA